MTNNFVPHTRSEAIQQFVDAAMSYRRSYDRPRSIGRKVALKAIKKAKRIRDAEDWRDAMLGGF